MEQLKAQLASIEEQLTAEKQKGSEGDRDIIARLESEQAQLLEQIMLATQEQEQQDRELHKQEVNETNSEVAIAVFEALIPDPKVFESLMGLAEFGDWRSGFYQLFDAALADRTKLMDDKHTYEIAQKDEKIRLLSGQGLEMQRQLDQAKNELSDYIAKYERDRDMFAQNIAQLSTERDELKMDVENVRNERDIAFNSLREVREQAAELKAKLEAAQKPSEEVKPSQSFTDRMNEIKSKNEARIKSAAELALEGTPFRGKVEMSLPEIKQQELPFYGENGYNPASNPANTELPSAQTNAPVEVPQFPVTPPNVVTGTDAVENRESTVARTNVGEETPVSRAEHAALQARVEALEGKVA